MLGLRTPSVGPIEFPVRRTAGAVLDGIGAVLGHQPGTERAALVRIARLDGARSAPDATV